LREKREFVSRIALLVDLLAIILAFPAAYHTQHLFVGRVFRLTQPIGEYLWLIALVAGIWMILLVSRHLHHFFSFITTLRELVRQIAWVSVIGSFLLMGILFVLKVKVNRSLVLAYIVYLTAFLIVFKAFFRSYLIYLSQTGRVCRNVLIVGAGRVAARVIRGFDREPALGRRVVGCVMWGDRVPRTHFMGVPVIGTVDELSDILHRLPVDEVIQAVPPTPQTPYQPVLRCCQEMGIPCRILSGLSAPQHAAVADDLWGHVFIVYQSGRKPLRQMVFKHALDFAVSLLAVIVAAPLIGLIALLVRATSKGSAFFIQERHGLNGRKFLMYKFRTMVADAEAQKARLAGRNEMSGPVFKIADDPRITPVGRFLRKTSLDELPQLFNVLRGEMSLVGPRPLPVSESAEISGPLRRRLSMKPGMTCLWQISGRNNVDFNDWMKLDLEYIDRWSLGLDLRIILKTIPVVILGKGAR